MITYNDINKKIEFRFYMNLNYIKLKNYLRSNFK